MPKDLTTSDRLRIEGYTRFIRAYAYYNLLVDYGPPILLGDEVVNTNESLEYYDRPRATYDEAMEYVCSELEKAAELLPEDVLRASHERSSLRFNCPSAIDTCQSPVQRRQCGQFLLRELETVNR